MTENLKNLVNMEKNKPKKSIVVKFDEHDVNLLERLKEQTRMKASDVIRQALYNYDKILNKGEK